jgi:nucleotide-binding universal stress UspA family protein
MPINIVLLIFKKRSTLVHQPKEITMNRKILIATDGSATATCALQHALGLAASEGAEVIALTVLQRRALDCFNGVAMPGLQALNSTEQAAANHAQTALAPYVQRAHDQHLKLSARVVMSDGVAGAIVAASQEVGADLIVMGTSRNSWAARLWGHRKAKQVLAGTAVPLLMVQTPQPDPAGWPQQQAQTSSP